MLTAFPALVALEAGCTQRPAHGQFVGLNDTIFSTNIISIVNPSTVGGTPSGGGGSGGGGASLPITAVIGIIVAVVLLLAAMAAFLYIRYRKAKARLMRASAAAPPSKIRSHRPQSSLSFRCQTHLSPVLPSHSPVFPSRSPVSPYSENEGMKEAPKHITSTKSAPWKSHNSVSLETFQSASTVTNVPPPRQHQTATTIASATSLARLDTTVVSRQQGQQQGQQQQPYSATDSPISISRGSPVLKRSGRGRSGSLTSLATSVAPAGVDPFATPISTTSTFAPSPLPRYNPANYVPVSAVSQYASPSSAQSTSPLLRQREWSPLTGTTAPSSLPGHPRDVMPATAVPSLPQAPPPSSRRTSRPGGGFGKGEGSSYAPGSGGQSVSPVSSTNIQVMFPGPPPPQRRYQK